MTNEVYDKLIFMSEAEEEEWNALDEYTKRTVLSHLKHSCSVMSNRHAIGLLCHAINDLGARIVCLEEKLNDKQTPTRGSHEPH